MQRFLVVIALAALVAVQSHERALAQTVTIGPADAPVTLHAAELAARAGQVLTRPDGSRVYLDVPIDGDGWRVELSSLTVSGSANERGTSQPVRVSASLAASNLSGMSQNYVFTFTTPATMVGDVTAGATAAVALVDSDFTGDGSLQNMADDPAVEIVVDGVRTGAAAVEEVDLAVAHAGQNVALTGQVGLPESDLPIATPSTSLGLRLALTLSPGDMLATTAAVQALEVGATATKSADDPPGEPEHREIHVEMEPAPVPRGVDASPVRVINGAFGATNVTAMAQTFTVTITLPVTALSGGTVMGGAATLLTTDGNFDGAGGASAPPGEAVFEGSSDGSPPSLLLLDSVDVTPSAAGESIAVIDAKGVPGPSISPGPAVSSELRLRYRLLLQPGDVAAVAAVFAVGTPFCPTSPQLCLGFEKASLAVSENKPGKEKLKAKLSGGPALTQTAFGNPLSGGGTAYDVCIYNQAGVLAGSVHVDRAGADCSGEPCWQSAGDPPPDGKGYLYSDKTTSAGGAKSLKLLGGNKSKIGLVAKNKGKKGQLSLATGIVDALAGSSSVNVQVHGSGLGSCFGATLTDVVVDGEGQFKAKK